MHVGEPRVETQRRYLGTAMEQSAWQGYASFERIMKHETVRWRLMAQAGHCVLRLKEVNLVQSALATHSFSAGVPFYRPVYLLLSSPCCAVFTFSNPCERRSWVMVVSKFHFVDLTVPSR